VRDEAFGEWEEMFALNDSTPYGNEICGSHRSARPISKVSARVFVERLRRDSKFFRTRQEGVLRMYEGERKRNIRSALLSMSLKDAIIGDIEVVLYFAKISI